MTTPMPLRFVAVALLAATALSAQQPDFRWEKAIAAGSRVSAHNLNGNVRITPSTSGKVEVVGTKHGDRRYLDDVTIEVVETSGGVMICSMFKNADMSCDEDGFHVNGRRGYRDRDFDDVSIDMEVRVPKGMRVSANSVSGDVSISGAEGTIRAGSVSGNVRVDQVRAASVRASSVSGDIDVTIDALTGDGDLEFSSVSGNVTATLPKDINADVTMRSVSGSLDSDFPLTLSGRMSRRSLDARIGKGGRNLDVHTVSGDVRLRAARQ